jgi:hypothetical protein
MGNESCDSSWAELRDRLIEEEKGYRDLGWPDHLIKAANDPFIYAAYVDGMGVILFTEADVAGVGWVHLKGIQDHEKSCGGFWDQTNREHRMNFERGVDVRLDAIRWVADAPWGS